MEQYGRMTNGQLEIVTYIDHENGRTIGINSKTAQLFGLKEIVDVKPDFYNYDVSYTETNTQIIVNYVEVVVAPMAWHEDTNFQIKFRPMDLIELLAEHKGMIEYTDTLKRYTDIFENVYFYVNYFTDMEKELIDRFAIVTPKL